MALAGYAVVVGNLPCMTKTSKSLGIQVMEMSGHPFKSLLQPALFYHQRAKLMLYQAGYNTPNQWSLLLLLLLQLRMIPRTGQHLIPTCHGDVVCWEEALLAVLELPHPPAVAVFVKQQDVVPTEDGQFVWPLGLVVIQCHHLIQTVTMHHERSYVV